MNEKSSQPFSKPVFIFCLLYFFSGLILIAVGGNVTSRGYGLAVPDWPSTFGYNMFLVPLEMWVGVQGVFEEHGHRLLGAWLGILAIVSTAIGFIQRRSTKWFSLSLLVGIIIQGLFGGFRVTVFFQQMDIQLATMLRIFHGVTAQIILSCLLILLLMESPWWTRLKSIFSEERAGAMTSKLRLGYLVLLIMAVIQLTFGAYIRHTSAGLAIPDYPASYGQLVPPMSEEKITLAMRDYAASHEHFEFDGTGQIFTSSQVALQWLHTRLSALAILVLASLLLYWSKSQKGAFKLSLAIFVLIVFQALLGISTVVFQRPPDLATIHQTSGAVILALLFSTVFLLFKADRTVSSNISQSSSTQAPTKVIAGTPEFVGA